MKMKKEEIVEALAEALAEVDPETYMESLKEKDRYLKLTDECKECYDYLAKQFIFNYIKGKSMFDIMEDIESGKYYNTWLVFLGIVKHIVKAGGKFHGYENIINSSGIPRETWMMFFDQLER